MRNFLVISLILLLPINGFAQIAFVQAPTLTITDTASTTVSKAFGSNVTAGSLGVACVGWQDALGTTDVSTVVGSSSGSWASVRAKTQVASIGGDWSVQLWYKENMAGGADTITATYSASVAAGRIIAPAEFSGAATTTPLDQSNGNPQTDPGDGANAVVSGNITTTADNELVFACVHSAQVGLGAPTAGTGYTAPQSGAVGTFDALTIEYKLNFDTGTTAGTFTLPSGSTNDDTATQVGSFKEPASAATRRCKVIGGGVGGC